MDQQSVQIIINKLDSLEKRIQNIEEQSQIIRPQTIHNDSETSRQAVKTQTATNKHNNLGVNSSSKITVDESAIYQPTKNKANSEQDLSSDYGWMGFLGILFMVFAAVFFIKLTIDAGWLTPERQVMLAVLFGVFLIFSPKLISKLSDKEYSSMLAAAGVAVLHMSWFGAHVIHDLITPIVGLMMASVVGVVCLFLQSQNRNPLFALVAIAGTYISVLVMGGKIDKPTLAGFILVWNLSFCLAALYLNTRFVLTIAAYFAILIVAMLGLDKANQSMTLIFIFVQSAQFFTFAAATVYYSILHKSSLNQVESKHLMILGTIVYACIYSWVNVLYPGFGAWTGIAIAISILSAYLFAEKRLGKTLESREAIFLTIGIIIFHSLFLDLTPDDFKPLWGLMFLVAFIVYKPKTNGDGFLPLKALVGLMVVWCLLLTFNDSEKNHIAFNFAYGVLGLLTYLSIYLSAAKSVTAKDAIPAESQIVKGLLFVTHAEVLFGIYRLSLQTEFIDSIIVSVLWASYSIAILFLGWSLKDRILAQSSLLMLIASVIKVIFYDLSSLGSVEIIFCFLIVGALLYGSGMAYRKMKPWPVN